MIAAFHQISANANILTFRHINSVVGVKGDSIFRDYHIATEG